MSTLTITAPRKRTVFQVCKSHEWLESETRYRRAEFFTEGGPAGSAGCSGGECRLWPGTDLFSAEICRGEFALEWTAPRPDPDTGTMFGAPAPTYGDHGRHEPMRLFAPVAAPIPGQLEL